MNIRGVHLYLAKEANLYLKIFALPLQVAFACSIFQIQIVNQLIRNLGNYVAFQDLLVDCLSISTIFSVPILRSYLSLTISRFIICAEFTNPLFKFDTSVNWH